MKILYVTTISATMTFFIEHIKMLINEGNSVELACNCTEPVSEIYNDLGCIVHDIPFSRSPFSKNNIVGYKMLKKIVGEGNYDVVHTHTPNASLCTRLACIKVRKKGTKVFYTAHGFHFFKGAPLKNWALYYPVEKVCSRFTDTLITINHEDYSIAQKKMKAKKVFYVPGVGIDLQKIYNVECDKNEIRKSLLIPDDAILLFSVGELNENKNHQIVLQALAKIKDDKVHYMIAGFGEWQEKLVQLAKDLNIKNQVHFLGYRTDVLNLYKSSDIFVFPSLREGLSVSLMESMACGLPVICSNIRGNIDLIDNCKGGFLFKPDDSIELQSEIIEMVNDKQLRFNMGVYNKKKIKLFDKEAVKINLKQIYEEK